MKAKTKLAMVHHIERAAWSIEATCERLREIAAGCDDAAMKAEMESIADQLDDAQGKAQGAADDLLLLGAPPAPTETPVERKVH